MNQICCFLRRVVLVRVSATRSGVIRTRQSAPHLASVRSVPGRLHQDRRHSIDAHAGGGRVPHLHGLAPVGHERGHGFPLGVVLRVAAASGAASVRAQQASQAAGDTERMAARARLFPEVAQSKPCFSRHGCRSQASWIHSMTLSPVCRNSGDDTTTHTGSLRAAHCCCSLSASTATLSKYTRKASSSALVATPRRYIRSASASA